ncbi:MAG: sensor histidine kinase [Chloroflexales bacterium]|nr:sensor histidine kinase [Chloroflexales bacterium]
MMNWKPSQRQPATHDERQRRSRLVLYVLLLLVAPFVLVIVIRLLMQLVVGPKLQPPHPPPNDRPAFFATSLVITIIFISALVLLIRLRRPTLSALLLIGIWSLLTTVTTLRFGIMTFLPAMFILPICAAGLLIDRLASVTLALLATAFVGAMAWTELFSPTAGRILSSFEGTPAFAFGFWVMIFWTVAILTALLSGGLQRALQQSRVHAEELAQLSAQLEERVAAQTAELLSQAQEKATLEERTRLAREIHDTLAQGLTGVVVQLGAAQRALTALSSHQDNYPAEELRTNLGLAQQMARESLAEARRSVWNLRTPALERGDLGDALRGLTTHPLRPETSVSFTQSGAPWPLSSATEAALLRVCQEALANVSKHAQATHVEVELAYTADAVSLSVDDNGVGFSDPTFDQLTSGNGPWGSFGVLGMRERVVALGGALHLSNAGGAKVLATIPRNDTVM